MKEEKTECFMPSKKAGLTFKIYSPNIVDMCIDAVLKTQEPIKNNGEEIICLSIDELRTALKTVFNK